MVTLNGKRPRRLWRYATPLVALLAGILFVTNAETARGTDLRSGRRTQLTDLIAAEQRRGQAYQSEIKDLRARINATTRLEGQRDSRVEEARERAEELGRRAGVLPVTGAGVRVTLDDAPRPGPGRKLLGNPSPDDLVVHQQDVQAVVNALWAGGATAMQVMDQRVISTSAVRCVGNTLILQGVVYSPPYTVTAIGDTSGMLAALDEAPDVRVYKQYVDAYGLGYKVKRLEKLTLQGYSGALDLEYASVPQS